MCELKKTIRRTNRRGGVMVMTLLLVLLLTTLALSMAQLGVRELVHVDSQAASYDALLAAESGMDILSIAIQNMEPTSPSNTTLLEGVGDQLVEQSTLSGAPYVDAESGSLVIPSLSLGQSSFTAELIPSQGGSTFELRVTGTHDDATRTVSKQFASAAVQMPIFNLGIATLGPLSIAGNFTMYGVRDPDQPELNPASIHSEATDAVKIELGDEGVLTLGNNWNPAGSNNTYIYLTGAASTGFPIPSRPEGDPAAVTINNETNATDIYTDYCREITDPADELDLPEIDTDEFQDQVSSMSSWHQWLSSRVSGLSWSNIRIPAGTDPTFLNATLNGVVYVESPNKVTFKSTGANQTTVNAIIVTDTEEGGRDNQRELKFTGDTVIHGTGGLPDNGQWDVERGYTGTVILAPGFHVKVSGTMDMTNGVSAARQWTFDGTTDVRGSFMGTVIGLDSEDEISILGTANFEFNATDSSVPAGFLHKVVLDPVAGTYHEVIE